MRISALEEEIVFIEFKKNNNLASFNTRFFRSTLIDEHLMYRVTGCMLIL